MRTFYALMLWLTELELAAARSTGRNQTSINALITDRSRWSLALARIDFPLGA
jgi:hypothetical protein